MADIRFKDLTTTASSTASDDFIAVDGTTNGTRKLSAFSPTFGGNATVTGTLTVNGVATAGSYLTSAAGLGFPGALSASGYYLYSGSANGLTMYGYGSTYDVYIGNRAGTRALSVAANSTVVSIPDTTASTTTSSGALVIGNGTQGGLGVGGAINAGGVTATKANGTVMAAYSGASGSFADIAIGRTASEHFIGVAGASNNYVTGTVAGDWALNAGSAAASIFVGINGSPVSKWTSSGLTVTGTLTVNGTTFRLNSKLFGVGDGTTTYLYSQGSGGFILRNAADSADIFRITNAGATSIVDTTASTSTSSGALVVGNGTSGGLGVGGAVNAANLRAAAGTGSSVSFGYTSETNTGFFLPYANWNQATVNGVSVAAFVAGYNGAVGGMILINNLTTPPNANPSGGGWLYCEGGALKYRGSSGTVTTIANA